MYDCNNKGNKKQVKETVSNIEATNWLLPATVTKGCTSSFSLSLVKRSEVKITQSCLTLCDPMDYTVQGILQARDWSE